MNYTRQLAIPVLILGLCGLGACASIPENAVRMPEVELRDIQVVGLGFKAQTFLLSFGISNPNPFPLPVSHIRYGLKLDGQRFASGAETVFMSRCGTGVAPSEKAFSVFIMEEPKRLVL